MKDIATKPTARLPEEPPALKGSGSETAERRVAAFEQCDTGFESLGHSLVVTAHKLAVDLSRFTPLLPAIATLFRSGRFGHGQSSHAGLALVGQEGLNP